MDIENARQLAKDRLKGVTTPEQKINTVNQVIAELAQKHNFAVLCPVSHNPLKGVTISSNPAAPEPMIHYHPIL